MLTEVIEPGSSSTRFDVALLASAPRVSVLAVPEAPSVMLPYGASTSPP